jgi:hypothetical protein
VKHRTALAVAFAAAATVTAAPAAGAVSGGHPVTSCKPSLSAPYHYAGAVIIDIFRSCGHEYAAWGTWVKNGASDTDTGRFKASGFIPVCDVDANCVQHPDGKLVKGGWQREGHPRHCSFGCTEDNP